MDPKTPKGSGALHAVAIILALFGAGAIGLSMSLDTSVSTGYGYGAETVFNIGLLQNQMMLFQGGLAALIAAVIVWAVGRLTP